MAGLSPEQKAKLKLLEMRKQLQAKLRLAFDPMDLSSRHTPAQLQATKSTKRIKYAIGSNRSGKCLASGTEVLTHNRGMVKIENLVPGDLVYDQELRPIKVVRVESQGVTPVIQLTWRGQEWAVCTPHHRWLTQTTKHQKGVVHVKEAQEIYKGMKIVRREINAPLGQKSVPNAYALGALLGDGCSREGGLVISSIDGTIPSKVADQLGLIAHKNTGNNYSWIIKHPTKGKTYYKGDDLYDNWIRGKYAHEKTADIEELRLWNRESLLQFVAGLLDTDGSVSVSKDDNCLQLRLAMQAKPVVDAFKWAFLALWQYPLNIQDDSRIDRYKNGKVYGVGTKNSQVLKRALKELAPYMVSHKKWRPEWEVFKSPRWNPEELNVTKVEHAEVETWDIEVDSPDHLYCLGNGLVTHNTAWGGREVAWWFNNDHPYHDRPAKWGSGPISIIVMGQSNDSLSSEVIPKKLQPFIGTEGVDYSIQRVGGYPKQIRHLKNGNTILFLTHSDAEQARRRAQSFTTHVVWLDEMPPISAILTELILRVLTTQGFLYCTFTPLFTNDEIRKIIDTPSEDSEKFKFSILDNPSLTEEERSRIIETYRKISGSESEFRARLYGEWMAAGLRVYSYDAEKNYATPDGYDPYIWPHIVAVDPAASSRTGLLVAARRPDADEWFIVKAKYLSGTAFSDLVPLIESEVRGLNILERICDCTPSAFYIEAMKQGVNYRPIAEKKDNKEKWIERTNNLFTEQRVFLTDGASDLAGELNTCARREDDPSKIIKASKYHISDCLRYFAVSLPTFKVEEARLGAEEQMRRDWKNLQRKREQAAYQKKQAEDRKESQRAATKARILSRHRRRGF